MSPVTRSVARAARLPLLAMDAGVQKSNKNLQCIICAAKFASKAWLSRHFKDHKTRPGMLSPFAHPSCWTAEQFVPPANKEDLDEIGADENQYCALPSRKQREVKHKVACIMDDARTVKELREKSKQKNLRLMYWWFTVNEESLRARMTFGPEGLFPRHGEPKLQQQFNYPEGITAEDSVPLKLASVTSGVSKAARLSAAPPPSHQASRLAPDPSPPPPTVSAPAGFFDHEYGRSLTGKVIADFELASNRPLTATPVLSCLSDSIIGFVTRVGENEKCAVQLAQAARNYLNGIGSDRALTAELDALFVDEKKYKDMEDVPEDEEDENSALIVDAVNRRTFVGDRKVVWDVLEKTTREDFDALGGELDANGEMPLSDLVRGMMRRVIRFARVLKDWKTVVNVEEYLKRNI